jgi:hypothetical protein
MSGLSIRERGAECYAGLRSGPKPSRRRGTPLPVGSLSLAPIHGCPDSRDRRTHNGSAGTPFLSLDHKAAGIERIAREEFLDDAQEIETGV